MAKKRLPWEGISNAERRRRILMVPCGRCWAAGSGEGMGRPVQLCPVARGWHDERRRRAVRKGLLPPLRAG